MNDDLFIELLKLFDYLICEEGKLLCYVKKSFAFSILILLILCYSIFSLIALTKAA